MQKKPAIIAEIGIYYSEVKGKARMISADKLKSMALDNERMISAFLTSYKCDAETARTVMLHYIFADAQEFIPEGLRPADVHPWEQKEPEKPEKPAKKRGKKA